MSPPLAAPPHRYLSARLLSVSRQGLSPLEDSADTPTLITANRPALYNQHPVADMTFVSLIMRLHLGAPAQDLLVFRMQDSSLDRHDDRLLHTVADDYTRPLFPQATAIHTHTFRPRDRSRRIVSTRAKSRLVSASFIGFSNRLVARCNFK